MITERMQELANRNTSNGDFMITERMQELANIQILNESGVQQMVQAFYANNEQKVLGELHKLMIDSLLTFKKKNKIILTIVDTDKSSVPQDYIILKCEYLVDIGDKAEEVKIRLIVTNPRENTVAVSYKGYLENQNITSLSVPAIVKALETAVSILQIW